METSYIALLRGINVGGKNIIKMETLKQAFIDMEFSDVITYIQSGNVIFKTQESDKSDLTKRVENHLQKVFSAEIKTLILTAKELAEIIKFAPESFGAEPEKFRYDVWFPLPPTKTDDIVSNIRLREGIDFLHTGENAIYTLRLTSQMGKSYFSKILQTPVCKNITIRNWNTTKKLLELSKNLK